MCQIFRPKAKRSKAARGKRPQEQEPRKLSGVEDLNGGGPARSAAKLHGLSDPGVFLPPPPHDFVGRAVTLDTLYAVLAEDDLGKALLYVYGEPGCGKSTLALPGRRRARSTR
jgi:hypothetical protein